MRDFKKFTSVQIRKEVERINPALLKEITYPKGKQKFKIWQDRFDELYLESQDLLEDKLEYIHLNPLQEHWSLVELPEDYKYSSAKFYHTGENDIKLSLTHYLDVL